MNSPLPTGPMSHLSSMLEIESASNFLANLLRFENRQIKVSRVDTFRRTLEELLRHHYQHHWFPEQPSKGSGYRCLRINHKMDPLIARAGGASGFDESALRKLLPHELTLWIDPREVSYRIGENGSICVLYDGSEQQFYYTTTTNNNNQDAYQQQFPTFPIHYFPALPPPERYPGCKESVRNNNRWDAFNSNPRGHAMVEPYAAFVSS